MKKTNTKKANPLVMNLQHPSFAGKIEKAFVANGMQYYCFKSDSDQRYGRYVIMQAFLQEYNLRTSLDQLKASIAQIRKHLNPSVDKNGNGQINFGKALEILEIMEQRANIAFEPDTVYRLASCLYFDEEEILTGYDKAHNEQKIARWKEADVTDFFFHRLFQELTHLTVTSREDLVNYLHQVPELLKGWNSMQDILSQ